MNACVIGQKVKNIVQFKNFFEEIIQKEGLKIIMNPNKTIFEKMINELSINYPNITNVWLPYPSDLPRTCNKIYLKDKIVEIKDIDTLYQDIIEASEIIILNLAPATLKYKKIEDLIKNKVVYNFFDYL